MSDQDDIWEKNKITESLRVLGQHDILVHDAKIIDENNNCIADSFYAIRNVKRTVIGNIIKFGYLGCCLVFKRKVLSKALPFPKNHKYATHDNWLFLIGCIYFKYKIINNKLILYRRHHGNASTGQNKGNKDIIFRLKYRIYLIINILKRI